VVSWRDLGRNATQLARHANWAAYVKIGKAVLHPVEELDAWDRKILVTCRTPRALGHDSRTTPAIGAASPTG
jgi:hypothetical protein